MRSVTGVNERGQQRCGLKDEGYLIVAVESGPVQ